MLEEAIANGAVSALAVTVVECLDDLVTVRKWQGRTVNVRSVIRNKHLGGVLLYLIKQYSYTRWLYCCC